ncbi:MAG: hypothetical protein JO108_15350 [Acidobacteriaceae bacterium]|nr:hypothetical protein [Acidobacteriaceae bacterium]
MKGLNSRSNPKLQAGDNARAKQLAAQAPHYARDKSDLMVLIGMVNYGTGDKGSALSQLQKAKQSDPKLRQEFESLANFVPHFKPILSGKEFTRKFFGQP